MAYGKDRLLNLFAAANTDTVQQSTQCIGVASFPGPRVRFTLVQLCQQRTRKPGDEASMGDNWLLCVTLSLGNQLDARQKPYLNGQYIIGSVQFPLST